MMIPVRGGWGLVLSWSLAELVERHGDVNLVMEKAWASLLLVLAERWPDWPVEVWTRLERVQVEGESDEEPTVRLSYLVSFAGELPGETADLRAMSHVVLSGLGRLLESSAEPRTDRANLTWLPLWALDDAQVFRLLAPERTLDESVYLVGHYAGEHELFAAAVEAWPLNQARVRGEVPVKLADVDTEWADGF